MRALIQPPSTSFLKYLFEPRVQKQSTCSLFYHRGMKAKPELLTVQCWQESIQIIIFGKSFQHHKNVSLEDKKIPHSSFSNFQQFPFPKQLHQLKQETSSKREATLEYKLLYIKMRKEKETVGAKDLVLLLVRQ